MMIRVPAFQPIRSDDLNRALHDVIVFITP